MPKITPSKRGQGGRQVIKAKTTADKPFVGVSNWWKADSAEGRGKQMLASASFLKEQQAYRYRQAAIYARLYSNMPINGWVGGKMSKLTNSQQLPLDRPTMNVIQSCADTLISRLTQSRPRPVFLTDNGDFKQRKLAKQMNEFVQGEFFQCNAYGLGARILLDAAIMGTGVLKVFETQDNRVGIERILPTEILIDQNDGLYGAPRQIYQTRTVDRDVLADWFPEEKKVVGSAEQAYPDNGGESSRSISDQVLVVEGWHLPSGPDAKDGRHIISCSSGNIVDEEWESDKFPFVFLNYSNHMLGFWGQPLAEQIMGTQVEINKLLMTITASINLVGVPRVFVEKGSKVVSAHLNNQVGSIVYYSGMKPSYEIAPCMPAEIYAQLQRLVDYAYQQSGISALAASSQKPQGLNSGAAIREFDDLQSDRFAALSKRYDNMYMDLAYQVFDVACKIVKRDGNYDTVYPSKNGTKEIDFPDIKKLEANPFVFQCYDASSLPRDPAGRMQKIVEMIQGGMISVPEGRRLLDFPDIEQQSKLDTASEERILQILDNIVEEGDYQGPDPWMDIQLADKLCTQYYNLYMAAKLDEDRADLLRTFSSQVKYQMGLLTPPQPMQGGLTPQAAPQPLPQSPMVPNAPAVAA